MMVDYLVYRYRWDRKGRKGELCNVLARGKMNSCLVEFSDGYQMVTSRNAIKRERIAAPAPPHPAEVLFRCAMEMACVCSGLAFAPPLIVGQRPEEKR